MSTTQPLLPDLADEPPVDDGRGGLGRGRVLLAVAIVVVLVAVVAIWIVAFTPVLGAKTVTVRGTHHLTAARVREAAAIKRGTPLLRLETSVVTRRVEALPDVADATVRTAYPSTVIITVVERVAVGYLAAGDRYVLVDKSGEQFRTVTKKPAALPLFAVPPGAGAKAAGRAVATVANALSRTVLAKVASVQAFDPSAITLLLDDHRVVRWGSADRSADKARILPTLLAQPGSQFDLTNPDQVVTR